VQEEHRDQWAVQGGHPDRLGVQEAQGDCPDQWAAQGEPEECQDPQAELVGPEEYQDPQGVREAQGEYLVQRARQVLLYRGAYLDWANDVHTPHCLKPKMKTVKPTQDGRMVLTWL